MKKLLTVVLGLIVLATFTSLSVAQEEKKGLPEPGGPSPIIKQCPRPDQPHTITMTAPPPVVATPYTADFPAHQPIEPNFNGTTANRWFEHTFNWTAPGQGCRCLSAELTIRYKALQGGASVISSDAGNDTVGIYSGGSLVPGTGQRLYTTFPFSAGQPGTKTIRLSCDMLKNNRLSFLVQDDTSVTSATLHIVYCCPPCPPGMVEMTFPGTSIKFCCDHKPGDAKFCCTPEVMTKPVRDEIPR